MPLLKPPEPQIALRKVAVGTGQKAMFVLVPETPDAEIAGDGLDIGRAVFLESAAKELFCPVEFH